MCSRILTFPTRVRSYKVWAEALKEGTVKEEKSCGHGKCTRCSEISTDLERYKGRMDREGKQLYAQALADQATHAAEHGGERDYAEDWWHAAQKSPAHVTAMSMDAPTEKQFDIPVQVRCARDTVKALEGAKRWSSKITGVMISGIGILAYVTRDGLGSGGDLSCTVLYLALCEMVKHGRQIGQRFNVLLDNTAADNKNTAVLAFLAYLVALDIVTEASTFFMLVDHTYCRIDQSFRALIGHLLAAAVYTPIALVQSIFTYLQVYNCVGVHDLHCIWDWKSFFEPHLHEKFKGFATGQFGSGMHEFVLRKDKRGVVRLWFRKSSQASSWFPDGDGYEVFKSTPTGIPTFKAGLPDNKWKRAEVQSTILSWFRFMPLQMQELARVKAEWQSRFDSLPQDGDMSTLPEALRLAWVDLPRLASSRAPELEAVRQHSTVLENPAVNPVTGRGRTAADVAYELNFHRTQVRTLDETAIFQADFIFTNFDGSVQLCRVANGLCIADALEKDIKFTAVELQHHPQEGFPGFYGHFTLKENPHFDPKDKKMGLKYVRHVHVTREQILVYDVDIFETEAPAGASKKKLQRVSLESLRRLAEVSNAQPAVTDGNVPRTHARDGEGDGDEGELRRPLRLNTVSVLRSALEARGARTHACPPARTQALHARGHALTHCTHKHRPRLEWAQGRLSVALEHCA